MSEENLRLPSFNSVGATLWFYKTLYTPFQSVHDQWLILTPSFVPNRVCKHRLLL
ncbi:MAG: hypothetical protein OJF59_001605 [Cytophagales bacterium]|nr:MAG: hypothetical protein OJF59_001605 [Cytophagales bacterium]